MQVNLVVWKRQFVVCSLSDCRKWDGYYGAQSFGESV